MVDVVVLSEDLLAQMAGYGRTLVAFSGGVDSSVVLAAAVRALGTGQVAAVTAVSPSLPAAELAAARRFCADLGVAHHTPATDEMDVPGYRENTSQRCYFCKSVLLDTAGSLAGELGFATITTGTNASDVVAGFRPGIRAAAERGARTPLADAGLDKAAVRAIARHWGLLVWDKPAAACMASRVAYGISVTPARLARIERAETAVRAVLGGTARDLRVRDLGDTVRLEVDSDLVERARDDRAVGLAIRDAGFASAPIRVETFRSGSMNDLLADSDTRE
ncbi:ATP-dependent sacrificial sulfur transferase LarE [Actinomadura sp. DC4]|uniref:ATP-dependent sacrificial sulfur transferase LarE n=1 Tax=Actinomadura sp. DC4 TaxID=3055069 RepID=UPI0025AF1E33|nr:ATP-dependent sacrificial sulfur transferase LarE [Actinomadura sp. DC4]MDN3351160.1 ATP-dependent sacrificial sulfur transferase LarE [Actinomadura sp. DC4]